MEYIRKFFYKTPEEKPEGALGIYLWLNTQSRAILSQYFPEKIVQIANSNLSLTILLCIFIYILVIKVFRNCQQCQAIDAAKIEEEVSKYLKELQKKADKRKKHKKRTVEESFSQEVAATLKPLMVDCAVETVSRASLDITWSQLGESVESLEASQPLPCPDKTNAETIVIPRVAVVRLGKGKTIYKWVETAADS